MTVYEKEGLHTVYESGVNMGRSNLVAEASVGILQVCKLPNNTQFLRAQSLIHILVNIYIYIVVCCLLRGKGKRESKEDGGKKKGRPIS